MDLYLLVCRPTDEVLDTVQEFARLVTEWSDPEEFLFDITDFDGYSNGAQSLQHACYENPEMRIGDFSKDEFVEFITTDKVPQQRLSIEDVTWDYESAGVELLNREGYLGDIRKYMSTIVGGTKFSINFGLSRSLAVRIDGIEPISMDSVEFSVESGMAPEGMMKGEQPPYPPAERIVEWGNRVDEEWGLECGAIGGLHFNFGEEEFPEVGFDGFIIYGADEDVKDWCDERWTAVDSWSNRDQLDFPYMYPSEYDLRTSDEKFTMHDVVRMWWD